MSPDKHPPTDVFPLIDAHAHVGPFRNFHIPDAGPDGVVRAMDALGIDMTILSSHAAISGDIIRGNDETLAAIDRHPDRLRGYCVVNPNFPDLTEREIERCFAHPGIRGFKFHPELHGDYPLDDDGYRPAWEYAHTHRLPVLSHSYFAGDPLSTFAAMATRYPGATVIIGHAGLDYGLARVADVVNAHPNILLDLCGALAHRGVLETLLERVGAGRLMFGSDMPFINGARQLGAIVTAPLDRDTRDSILGHTARRVFRLDEDLASLAAAGEVRLLTEKGRS